MAKHRLQYDDSSEYAMTPAEQIACVETFVDARLDAPGSPFLGGGVSVLADGEIVIELRVGSETAPAVPKTVAGLRVIVYDNVLTELH